MKRRIASCLVGAAIAACQPAIAQTSDSPIVVEGRRTAGPSAITILGENPRAGGGGMASLGPSPPSMKRRFDG